MTTLLAAMGSSGVQRLIGCSTWGIMISSERNMINSDEETPLPEKPLFAKYVSTKYASEQLVLEANCDRFLTACIRPILMYGELDDTYMSKIFRNIKVAGGTFYRINCGNNIHQQAYVGNVAWAFICAERSLWKECKNTEATSKNSFTENTRGFRSNIELKRPTELQSNTKSIAGQVFYVADDTPCQNMVEFQRPFVEACDYKMSKFKVPISVAFFCIYIIYFIFLFLSFFGVKKNIAVSVDALKHFNGTYFFKYDKAKHLMGYSPLFSVEESFERTKQYCKEQVKEICK